ncbi:MAG: carboxypeptidase regulatory-like domain-containing protein [Flavobacteriales bacterium]
MVHTTHHLVRRALLKGIFATVALAQGSLLIGQSRSGIVYEIIVKGQVLDETTGDPVRGAMVLVRRDGHSQDLVVTKADGQYELVLERGSLYDITYTAAGQVAKRVRILTKGTPSKLDVPSLTMTVDITLFPSLPGLDASLFNDVLGRAEYDDKARNFLWDEEYGKRMRASIRRFMARYDAQLEKQEAVAGR